MGDITKPRPDLSVYVDHRATVYHPIPASSGTNEDSTSILNGPYSNYHAAPRVSRDVYWNSPSGTGF